MVSRFGLSIRIFISAGLRILVNIESSGSILITITLTIHTPDKYVFIFRNQGEAAGASLAHPHSQLIALPVVPKRLMEELNSSREYFNYKERCIYCDIVRQEKEQNVRIISENQDFMSIAPFASRFPFETWILPKRHNSSFEISFII